MYEQHDNSGSLFVNDKKETAKHPDRSGSATIGGKQYWVSGWVKKDKNGNPWMSLAFKPKGTEQPARQKPAARSPLKDEMQDEVPF